ncbi:MAG: tRNA (adenosine(37)-N6)-threonylcarbamoyltransferase complex dimerization subunit type 1 TsaB [Ruminococcaceae bacterium]|nr:tRNA (adenosine(37)-N6)-threonylcarbamoyltransferase complex dimerization subunit type 1 TsaB [Oscillospiraceae bacterium]
MTEKNINEMILAFDTSGQSCATAVAADGKVIASAFSNSGLTHSKTLLPSIESVLKDSQTDVSQINKIALTVGPGSFTGVKIGVSTAKGLAFAKKLPCLAVSTMAALACGAKGFDGIICPVSDARRGMLYNAVFRCERSGFTRLCEDRQIEASELVNELSEYVKSGEKILILGDGADILEKKCEQFGLLVYRAAQNVAYIHAEGIFEAIKEGFYEEKTAGELTAVYLRPPQAERERLERLAAEQKQKEKENN